MEVDTDTTSKPLIRPRRKAFANQITDVSATPFSRNPVLSKTSPGSSKLPPAGSNRSVMLGILDLVDFPGGVKLQ